MLLGYRSQAQFAIYNLEFEPSNELKTKLDSAIYDGLSKGKYLGYSECYFHEDYYGPLGNKEDWDARNKRIQGKAINSRPLVVRSNLELVWMSLTYEDVFAILLPKRRALQGTEDDPDKGRSWQEVEVQLRPKFLNIPRTYQVTLFLDSLGKVGFEYLNLAHRPPSGSFGFQIADIFESLGDQISEQLFAEVTQQYLDKISNSNGFSQHGDHVIRKIKTTAASPKTDWNGSLENQLSALILQSLESIKNKEILAYSDPDCNSKPLRAKKLRSDLGLRKLENLVPSAFEILTNEKLGSFQKTTNYQSREFYYFKQKQYQALGFRHQNGTTFWLDFESLNQVLSKDQLGFSLVELLEKSLWQQLSN